MHPDIKAKNESITNFTKMVFEIPVEEIAIFDYRMYKTYKNIEGFSHEMHPSSRVFGKNTGPNLINKTNLRREWIIALIAWKAVLK